LVPGKLESFRLDWKEAGLWNLVFLLGVLTGGFLAAHRGTPHEIAISPATKPAHPGQRACGERRSRPDHHGHCRSCLETDAEAL